MNEYRDEFEALVENSRINEAYYLLMNHQADSFYDPFFYNNICWTLNQLERYHEVVYHASKGLKIFPDDGYLYGQLGFAQFYLGDYEAAYTSYQKALELHYDEAWIFSGIGWILYHRNCFKEALQYYESALLEVPTHAEALIGAADCYKQLKQYDLALEYMIHYYDQEQDDGYLPDVIDLCKKTKQYDIALKYLNQYEEVEYQCWKRLQQSLIYAELGDYDKAIEVCLVALHTQTNIQILEQLVLLYRTIGNKEKANEYAIKVLPLLEDALILNDDDKIKDDYVRILSVSMSLLDLDERYRYIQLASNNGVNEQVIWYHLMLYYDDLGQYDTALKYCELVYENVEHTMIFLLMYGAILRHNKHYAYALTIIHKAIQLYGEEPSLLFECLLNEFLLKRYEQVVTLADKYLEKDDKQWRVYYYKTSSLYYLSFYQEALECFEHLNHFDLPKTVLSYIFELQAMILEKLNRYEDAAHAYEQANIYQQQSDDQPIFGS